MLTLAFDEENYDNVVFDAYEKEKKVHSLQGMVDSAGDHAKTQTSLGSLGDNDESSEYAVRNQDSHGTDRHIVARQIESLVQRSVRLQAMLACHRHVVPCCRGSRSS